MQRGRSHHALYLETGAAEIYSSGLTGSGDGAVSGSPPPALSAAQRVEVKLMRDVERSPIPRDRRVVQGERENDPEGGLISCARGPRRTGGAGQNRGLLRSRCVLVRAPKG